MFNSFDVLVLKIKNNRHRYYVNIEFLNLFHRKKEETNWSLGEAEI